MLKIEINYSTKVPQKYEALFRKLGLKVIKVLRIKKDCQDLGGTRCTAHRNWASSRTYRNLASPSTLLGQIGDNINLSVAFVSPQKIRELNKRYRGKDKVTDVLSFNGVNEIIICYSQAVKQAKEQKYSIKKEVSTLFTHGLLHLLGFDDKTKKGADEMNMLTEKILRG